MKPAEWLQSRERLLACLAPRNVEGADPGAGMKLRGCHSDYNAAERFITPKIARKSSVRRAKYGSNWTRRRNGSAHESGGKKTGKNTVNSIAPTTPNTGRK
jgi:hypothetical protein